MSNVFKKFAKGFTNNLKTIIQALIFSVVIWLFISIQIFPDITMHIVDIPVGYELPSLMVDESLYVEKIDTSNVAVRIEGKRYDISDITNDDFTATCDLSGIYESGEHQVPIIVTLNDQSKKCTILTTDLKATVKVVKVITRVIDVVPNTSEIEIADGMQIEGEITVEPSLITIYGEESLVNAVESVEASAIYDGVLDHTAAISAEPVFYNKYGAKIASPAFNYTVDPFTVIVPVYKVKTIPIQVKFTGSKNSYGFTAEDLRYEMSINEITLASPDSSIDNLDVIDIGEISLSSLTLKDLQGGVTLPVELPEGYKNISGNRSITVSFPQADDFGQLGFTVPSDNFTIINPPNNYNVKVLTNEMTVNVVGYSDYIQEMTSSDIYATINLLGMELSEGTKSVTVTFRLTGANVRAWVTGEEYKVDLLITDVEDTSGSE